MSNQTDVSITNQLSSNLEVSRRQPDGSIDRQEHITPSTQAKYNLPGLDVSLEIIGPEGIDYDRCPVIVGSEIPMRMKHSRRTRKWTLKINPNTTQPNLPHTVNVTIGPEEDE